MRPTRHRSISVVGAMLLLATAGCGASAKTYDIGAIFPLSSDKCQRYHGDESGTGMNESCMVTQEECKKAAADWHRAMEESGVHDSIDFTCN